MKLTLSVESHQDIKAGDLLKLQKALSKEGYQMDTLPKFGKSWLPIDTIFIKDE